MTEVKIHATIEDGHASLVGEGAARDYIALADIALTAGAAISPGCACEGCRATRTLREAVAQVLRHLGGTPAPDRAVSKARLAAADRAIR